MARRLIATAHVLREDRPRRRPFGWLGMHTEHHNTPTTIPDTTRRRAFLLDRAAKYYEMIRPSCVSTREGLLAHQIRLKDNGRTRAETLPASCHWRAISERRSKHLRRGRCPWRGLHNGL